MVYFMNGGTRMLELKNVFFNVVDENGEERNIIDDLSINSEKGKL